MKRNILYLAAAAVIALGFTSCNKDEKVDEGMQFRATMENTNAKTALVGTHINWVEGDEVMIYGTVQNGLYKATPDAEDATVATLTKVGQQVISNGGVFRAIYPAASAVSATSFTIPAVQESVDGSLANTFPMYAESYDENLQFKNLCGVLKIHLQQEGAKVSRIVVTAASEINGTFNINNSGEEPAISYNNGGNCTTTLLCSEAQDITNGKDFYIYMPAGEYSGLSIKLQNEGYGVEKNAPANVAVEILRSQYSTLSFTNVNMPIPPDNDHQWGLYSVSSTQQVWISPGNLQFNKTMGTYTTADQQTLNGTWRFAEHQYDRCGYTGHVGNVDGGNNNSSTAWIDLFGWATSGYNGYQPLPRNSYDHYVNFPLDEIGGTNYDWGVNMGDGWRTLTQAEWQCLVGSVGHVAARNGKCGGATVCGVEGYILLPDLWNGPSISTGSPYTSNVYDAEAWAEMESYGAAFLPITGRKSGGTIYINHDGGYYWTTTANGYGNTGRKLATQGSFTNNGIGTGNGECEGQAAVRLCKNYVPASSK